MSKIKSEITEGGWIKNDTQITFKNYKNIIAVQSSSNSNKPTKLKQYKKKNNDTRINTNTGEEIQCVHNEGKVLDTDKREVENAKDILLYNFWGHQNVVFITLTCETPTMDFNTIRKYFRNFYNKLKRKYGKLIYFYIIELQKERVEPSLHIHAVIKHTEKKRFSIPYDELVQLWKKSGLYSCSIERVETVEVLGTYFFKDFLDEETLKLYPKHSRIFYSSINLERVEKETCTMEEFIEKFGEKFYRDSSIINNIIDEETDKIMCRYIKQVYKTRKHKKHKKFIREIKKVLTVKQIEDTYLIVNDTPKKNKNIKLKINYQDEELMKKIKALKKRKYILVLRYEVSLRYDLSNAVIVDVIDKKDIQENHLF